MMLKPAGGNLKEFILTLPLRFLEQPQWETKDAELHGGQKMFKKQSKRWIYFGISILQLVMNPNTNYRKRKEVKKFILIKKKKYSGGNWNKTHKETKSYSMECLKKNEKWKATSPFFHHQRMGWGSPKSGRNYEKMKRTFYGGTSRGRYLLIAGKGLGWWNRMKKTITSLKMD